MRGNIQCLLLILIVTSIFVFINVDVSVLALVLIALAFRVYWADVELKKKLRVNWKGRDLIEIVFLTTFVLLEFFTNQIFSFVVLLAGYVAYVYRSRHKFGIWRAKLGY